LRGVFRLLFSNRWFALAWVALTTASVATFFAKDGGADRLAATAQQIHAQRSMLQAAASEPAHVVEVSDEPPAPETMGLQPLPGSSADPANPRPGDVFLDPATGRRVRAVSRDETAGLEPAFPDQ
jgi:hypothetical protein